MSFGWEGEISRMAGVRQHNNERIRSLSPNCGLFTNIWATKTWFCQSEGLNRTPVIIPNCSDQSEKNMGDINSYSHS